MQNQEAHVPDNAGGVKDLAAFSRNLRRLESLESLLSGGSEILKETMTFLQKARAELDAFGRDQELSMLAQEQLAKEKADLIVRINKSDEELQRAQAQLADKERELARANAELAETIRIAREKSASDAAASELKKQLDEATTALSKNAAEIQKLKSEQKELTSGVDERDKKYDELLRQHSALKAHVTTLEDQLSAEKTRRARLMEVVKSHDVTAKQKTV